ncbi:nuclear transport factor 2 family protein [Nocardia sp. NPDC005745]|uniref:YybH family protein n=1 Tax=Nocardia sp. NPDC005745 TaxID=3157061 RepID=UPI0033D194D8
MTTQTTGHSAEQAIANAMDTLREAYQQKDAALATSFYAKDGQYALFDIMPPLVDAGFDRLLEKTREFFDATEGPIELEVTDRHVAVSDSLAYLRGLMKATARFKDGRPIASVTRYTLIFQKVGNDWLVIHEHNSLPAEALAF